MNKMIKKSLEFIKLMNESKDPEEKKLRTKEYLAFARGERLSPEDNKKANELYIKDTTGNNSHLSQAKSILRNSKKDKEYGTPIKGGKSAIIGKIIGENVKAIVDSTGQGGYRGKEVYVGEDKEDIYPQVIDGKDIPESDIHSVVVVDDDTNEERGYKGQADGDNGDVKPDPPQKEEGTPPALDKIDENLKNLDKMNKKHYPHAPVGGEMPQPGITESNKISFLKEEEELQKQTIVTGLESIRMKYIKSLVDDRKLYGDLTTKAQSEYGMSDLSAQLEVKVDGIDKEIEASLEPLAKKDKDEIEEYQKSIYEEAKVDEYDMEGELNDNESKPSEKETSDEEVDIENVVEDDEDMNPNMNEDDYPTLIGGKADKMSIENIAKKHMVSKEVIEIQLEKGIEVEKEHTESETQAREIALDHLVELPDYYDRLNNMEKEGKQELEKRIEDKEIDLSNEITKDEKKELAKEPNIDKKNELDGDKENTFGTIDEMKKYTEDRYTGVRTGPL